MRYKKKWYDDYDWLHLQFVINKRSIPDIAASIQVSEETVRQLLLKHGLKKGKK